MIRPDYAQQFACVGPACEDTCCAGWTVSVDEAAYKKYVSLPAGPLRALVDTSILRAAKESGQECPAAFATVRMLPSGEFPFHSPERLCRIHVEHGEQYLCRTCATFPRTMYIIDELAETELSLSCPAAARLVLLSPRLLPPAGAPGYQITWDEAATEMTPLRVYFWQIRTFVVTLLQNRRYPLWQRMFLLGTFSRRLDALVRREVNRSFPDLLRAFSRAVAARDLCASMETIQADLALQLGIVLGLIAQRVHNNFVSPRLHEVLGTFAKGVGHSRNASIENQAAGYANAYTQFYEPFFCRHPHILENYLVNAVLRELFPFGQKLFAPLAEPEPSRAFAMLAIQFALIKGLLIGVAGARGRKFCSADVIRTVQTVSKHFEHNQQFLSDAYALLEARGLNNAHGLTMLLRN
jgi:lysine-N-methylase